MRLFLSVFSTLLVIWGVVFTCFSVLSITQPGGMMQMLVSLGVFAIGGALWMLTEISRQLEKKATPSSVVEEKSRQLAKEATPASSVAVSAAATPTPLRPLEQ